MWGIGCNGDGMMDPEPVEHSGEISEDQTWSGTHVMTEDVQVTGSVTVQECSTVEFAAGTLMEVIDGGSIRFEGDSDCPIRVTSTKGSPAAGDWDRIDIYRSANNDNLFEHTVVEYGGNPGNYGTIWVEGGAHVEIRDLAIRRSGAHGVYFENQPDLVAFENVDVTGVELEAVRISANDVDALESLSTDGSRVMVTGSQIGADSTWGNLEAPYLVDEGLSVQASWEVEAGAVVQMGSGAVISVENGGQLRVMGEPGNRVTFQSAVSSPAAGDWGRFDVYASAAADHTIQYADIMHAGSDTQYGALWVESAQSITLDNVSFSMVDSCDVSGGGTIDDTMTSFQRCS
jgi:hypothetical protein